MVERRRASFETVHAALGTSSVRVKQFVVQQSDDAPELDEVQIADCLMKVVYRRSLNILALEYGEPFDDIPRRHRPHQDAVVESDTG